MVALKALVYRLRPQGLPPERALASESGLSFSGPRYRLCLSLGIKSVIATTKAKSGNRAITVKAVVRP